MKEYVESEGTERDIRVRPQSDQPHEVRIYRPESESDGKKKVPTMDDVRALQKQKEQTEWTLNNLKVVLFSVSTQLKRLVENSFSSKYNVVFAWNLKKCFEYFVDSFTVTNDHMEVIWKSFENLKEF